MSTSPEEYAEWAATEAEDERRALEASAKFGATVCKSRRFVRLLPRYPGEGNRLARRTAAKGMVRR